MIDQIVKQELVCEAKKRIKNNDITHNIGHMESVLQYAKKIAEGYPETDSDILELSVWWHDVGRASVDSGHAMKGAEIIEEIFPKYNVDSSTVSIIAEAVANHSNSLGGKSKSVEGIILKDADKIDYLTPLRWQPVIDHKIEWIIKVGIKMIPVIRDQVLILPESKKLFDQILIEMRKYFRSKKKSQLGKHWKELLSL